MEINYGLDVVKDSLHVIKEANNVVKDVVKEKANGICAEGTFLRNAKGR